MSRARVLFSTLPIYQIVQLISLFSNSFDTPRQADNYGANGRLPLESPKKCTDFGKKGSDGVHLWIKFTIQNAALRVSRRKTSKTGLFLCVFEKYLLNCPKSTKPLLP